MFVGGMFAAVIDILGVIVNWPLPTFKTVDAFVFSKLVLCKAEGDVTGVMVVLVVFVFVETDDKLN